MSFSGARVYTESITKLRSVYISLKENVGDGYRVLKAAIGAIQKSLHGSLGDYPRHNLAVIEAHLLTLVVEHR